MGVLWLRGSRTWVLRRMRVWGRVRWSYWDSRRRIDSISSRTHRWRWCWINRLLTRSWNEFSSLWHLSWWLICLLFFWMIFSSSVRTRWNCWSSKSWARRISLCWPLWRIKHTHLWSSVRSRGRRSIGSRRWWSIRSRRWCSKWSRWWYRVRRRRAKRLRQWRSIWHWGSKRSPHWNRSWSWFWNNSCWSNRRLSYIDDTWITRIKVSKVSHELLATHMT